MTTMRSDIGTRSDADPGRLRLLVAVAVFAAVAIAGLAVRFTGSPTGRPVVVDRVAPRRPSLHAAPAADAAALNADVPRRLPVALAATVLAEGRPGVVFFFKAGCDCSKGFARLVAALTPHLLPFANCTAVIEGSRDDADTFARMTGLAIPRFTELASGLSRQWQVRKAGCFALVRPDGSVEAIWSGVSRQGFRDLAARLGTATPLPAELLTAAPGAAMAGCPFDWVESVSVVPAAVAAPHSSSDPAQENIR